MATKTATKRDRATCPNTITSSSGNTRRCSRALIGGKCPSCDRATIARCSEQVGDNVECGRPVKADGKCGVHLAGEVRRAANDERRAADRRASETRREEAEALCQRLRGKGVECQPAYSCANSEYTGGVELTTTADALRVLELVGRKGTKAAKRPATRKR